MPSLVNNPPKKSHHLRSLIVTLIWVGLAVLIVQNRQNITDWYSLRNYTAPTAISSIADKTTMTDYGRKVFYVNHPEVQSKDSFKTNCPNNGGEKTNILGCYKGGQRGVYVLSVTDQRLAGVEQVTAAHEMLHAAYDRLNSSDRQKVDKMLSDYYTNELKDPEIIKTMAIYKQTEPNDLVNEMHSIFGTEITNLPVGLEQYYKKYFTNRSAVTTYYNTYQGEFTSRQAKVADDDRRLEAMKAQINSLEADLKTRQADLDTQQNNLSSIKRSGNIDSYNAGVPGYNATIASFNASVEKYRRLIESYNALLDERNAVAFEENQLNSALSGQSFGTK